MDLTHFKVTTPTRVETQIKRDAASRGTNRSIRALRRSPGGPRVNESLPSPFLLTDRLIIVTDKLEQHVCQTVNNA